MLWSLCFVSSTNNQRKVVKVDPTKESIHDVYRLAGEAFQNSTAAALSPPATISDLKAGFPPQSLNTQDTRPLIESKQVSNQERIHVVFETTTATTRSEDKQSPESSVQKNKNKRATETTTSTTIGRRSKRAAAQVANDSFADVIREQDRLMKTEASKSKRKTRQRVNNNNNNNNNKTSAAGTAAAAAATTTKFTSSTPGRRLVDGAVVATSSPNNNNNSSKQKKRKSASGTLKKSLSLQDPSQEKDLSMALLGALNDGGSMGRILRKGMSNAVAQSYEATRAATRLAALESNVPQRSVQMTELVAGNSNGGGDKKLKVKYEKGVQGHGYFEETVDYIPTSILRQVVSAIYKSDKEGLRGHNLSFLSPRVLWALAWDHWQRQEQRQQQEQQSATTPTSLWEPFSLELAYRTLLPDEQYDWSFLRRRKQTLSAKAMENQRQAEAASAASAATGLNNNDEAANNSHWEQAASAIQDVETAMRDLQQHDRSKRAERVAIAAVARQQQQQQQQQQQEKETWKLLTPTEFDKDELLECIQTSPLMNPDDSNKIVQQLVEQAMIHNWRELANQDPNALYTKLVDSNQKANHELRLSQKQIEQWVLYARTQSLDEIIFEICNSNADYVELLREKANCGTPKDLCMFRTMPDMLLEELGDAAPRMSLTVAELSRFCERSHMAIQEYPWLDWFSSDIPE